MYARGAILGVTRGTSREHIIRAALESIAFQTCDVLHAMEEDTGITLENLRVDGGASANRFLMQFQSDMIRRPVLRPRIAETTALGAAFLAGLAVGVWDSLDQIQSTWRLQDRYEPQMQEQERLRQLRGWHKAVGRCLNWAREE